MGVEISKVTVTTCDWCQAEYRGEAELHLDTSESFRLWDGGMYGDSTSVDVCPACAKAFLDVRAETRGEDPTPEPEPLDLTAPNFFLVHTGNDLVDEILAAVVEAATMENDTLHWGEPRNTNRYRYENGESPVSRIQDAADQVAERLSPAGESPRVLELLDLLTDEDPCWFDHDGSCQAHGYSLLPGQICPQQEAKDLLSGTREQSA